MLKIFFEFPRENVDGIKRRSLIKTQTVVTSSSEESKLDIYINIKCFFFWWDINNQLVLTSNYVKVIAKHIV